MIKSEVKVDKTAVLKMVDRFFKIVVIPEVAKAERVRSEWNYFASLLSADQVEAQRVEVYLNIIEKSIAKDTQCVSPAQEKENQQPIIAISKTEGFSGHRESFTKKSKQQQSYTGSFFALTKKLATLFEKGQHLLEVQQKRPALRSNRLAQEKRQPQRQRFMSVAKHRF